MKPAGNGTKEALSLSKYFADLASRGRQASLTVQTGGVNASGTCIFADTGEASDTFLVNGVTFTAVSSGASGNQYNVGVKASKVIQDLTYTAKKPGSARNSITLTYAAPSSGTHALSVAAVANDITVNLRSTAAVAATASLATTTPIVLTSVAAGAARNTNTFTTQVLAPAANPTNTVLVAFTGTAAAITCTVTPNDGTHNSATAVDLTTAELAELITTGAVVGKTVTITDASSRRILQTATGGDTTVLADGGEGDGVVATFANGANFNVALSTATLIKAAIDGDVGCAALVSVAVTGTGSTVQVAASLVNLANGTGSATLSAASLASAITNSATSIVSSNVSASADTGTCTITATLPGTLGNAVTIAKGVDADTAMTVSGARLTSGANDTPRTYHCGL